MDSLTLTAASGMRSRMESLDMLANNIANAETSGYKIDREFYNLYTAPEAAPPDSDDPSTMPVIEKNYTDFSQGAMRVTANPLDFALQGSGFFAVNAPGGVAYTRNGNFQMTTAGTLVTNEGYTVRGVLRGTPGQPLQLNPALPVEVGADGTITQSGQTTGQFEILNFDNPGDLTKQGNTLFRPADPKILPKPANAQVQQGRLENSNVGTSESAVRLVNVLRQYEMLQKAVNIGADMNKQAIQEVARVGS
jgi:flagellar basal-body rod protein FlgF